MQLLDTASDSASLEFASYELDKVMRRLAVFGDLVVDHDATFDRLRVGAVELIYLDEWDSPCLIAHEPSGIALLRNVVDFYDVAPDAEPPPEANGAGLDGDPGFKSWRRRQS